ncbi:MAG: serine protein kinase RIO [Candidatus Methanomethylophilaceae archaeon]|jgi:RIO kinase 1
MASHDEVYAYLERHVDALKTNKTGDEKETADEVFDKQTLMTIYDFMTNGVMESVHYPISTGKEGNVFYVTNKDDEPMALKIFRTSNASFNRISKYIEGDPRFKGLSGNRRKLIYAWANKEYRNLQRYYEADIPVPEPIEFKKNCLLMEFIGDKHGPAPQIKNVIIKPKDVNDIYEEVLSFIIDGFQDAHLVHGDLSEYNILMWDGQPIMIDCGQALTADHFNAKEYLERDINNINRFFKNRGADIIDGKTIMEETLNGDNEEEEEEK